MYQRSVSKIKLLSKNYKEDPPHESYIGLMLDHSAGGRFYIYADMPSPSTVDY